MNENLWINRLIDAKPLTNQLAVREAKKGIQDYLASSFFAVRNPNVLALNNEQAVIYGQTEKGKRIGPATSHQALVYGFAAHYEDLDDTQSNLRGHPSAVILSALLAIAKPSDSGAKLLEAYIAGIEIAGRLGQVFNPTIYNLGWHSTGFIGVFGATAALIKFLNLDVDMANQAFSLAASQASGYRFQFGSDAKPLQAGIAAMHAIDAVDWALKGITGSDNYLFGTNGLVHMFEVDEAQLQNILATDWAETLEIVSPGLWFKAYPFCSAAFRLADAAINIYQEQPIHLSEIESIDISFNPGRDAALIYTNPKNGLQGKFSGEYVTLLGLTKGKFDPEDFTDDRLDDEVLETIEKVNRVYYSETEKGLSSQIYVKLKDKTTFQAEIFDPYGSPQNPLSEADNKQKLAMGFGNENQARIISQSIEQLEQNNLIEFLQAINRKQNGG